MTSVGDRRHHPRSSVSGTAMVRVIGETQKHEARIVDVSASGVLLETSQLAVGTGVQLRVLGDSGRKLEVNGVVVRSDDPYPGSRQTVAVCFDEISRTAVASLKQP